MDKVQRRVVAGPMADVVGRGGQYVVKGTPPGVFLGAGLAGLNDGRGVEAGSPGQP